MRLPKPIKERIPVALLVATGGLLASLLVKSVASTKGSYPSAVIATLQTEPAGSLILILLVLFLVALAWIVYLHYSQASDPESVRRKFVKDHKIGWMAKDGFYFCTKCLADDPPRIVRLVERCDDEDATDIWMCPSDSCRSVHFGINYRSIQKSKKK
jgi:hypothetical protein